MWTEPDDKVFTLSDAEFDVLTRSARHRGMAVQPERTLTKKELVDFGLVREAFSQDELAEITPRTGFVSSRAIDGADEQLLGVGSPHPSRIGKWQLPVHQFPYRPVMISFPPASKMSERVQPSGSDGDPGGALRVILTGRLACNGHWHEPGDWFFVENGTAYEMQSDRNAVTKVLYLYRFVSAELGGRFSFELSSH